MLSSNRTKVNWFQQKVNVFHQFSKTKNTSTLDEKRQERLGYINYLLFENEGKKKR